MNPDLRFEKDKQWWLDTCKNQTHEELVHEIYLHCMDWADTDVEVRKLAEPILGKEYIEGDSYGVPAIKDIVEQLVQRIKDK